MGHGRVLARPGRVGEKMRAVEGNLGHSLRENKASSEGPSVIVVVGRAQWETNQATPAI